jgi:predicted RNase H-like HicB family nuclease
LNKPRFPDLAKSANCVTIESVNLPISAEIHRDGDWYVAFCPEVPEANGQGRTEEECLESLRQAILLLMEDRREDAKSRLNDEATLLELA